MKNVFKKNVLSIVCLLCVILSAPAQAKEILTFHGKLDFKENDFTVFVDLGKNDFVEARAQKLEDRDYHIKFNVEHLKTSIFELSSEIESLIAVLNADNGTDPAFRGKLWSRYSILNYTPIRELSGSFSYENQRLKIEDVAFGSIKCSGFVDFIDPLKLDLTFNLTDVSMQDFLTFWAGESLYEATGEVSGEIRLTGGFSRPVLRGNLLSSNGVIKQLKYQTMKLNIEGIYPEMEIAKSFISQEDGLSYAFSGPINLSEKSSFKKQIRALNFIPLVKGTDDRVEWTIRRFEEKNGGSTQIKYLKMKNQNDSPVLFENSGMFGVEHTVDF